MTYRSTLCGAVAFIALAIAAGSTHAAAVRDGFNSTTFLANDDGTYPANGMADGTPPGTPVAQSLGFTADFFGLTFTSAFINNNGNITFDTPLATFTPFNLTSTNRQIIAPYFADVDTRRAGGLTAFGSGTVDGRTAFGVTWRDVDYYSSSSNHTNRNTFQLVLIDRSDVGSGDFDIEFNYDQIQWEAGTASSSDANGLGGSCARAGFSNGTGNPGTFYELPGAAECGSFLDATDGPLTLITHRLNSDVDGRYVFFARNGEIIVEVPEPSSLAIAAVGLAALALRRRKKT